MPTHTFDLVGVLTAAAQALSAGDEATAQRGCERALEHDSEQPNALHLLGLIAHRRGDYDRAIRLIERSIEHRGEPDAAWQHNLALSRSAAGQATGAIAAWRRAVEIDPTYAPAYAPLARSLADAGDRDAALDVHCRRVAVEPDNAQAHFELADLARQLGRHDLLKKHLVAAHQHDPQNRDAQLLKAFTCIEEGRFDAAKQTLDALASRHGDFPGSRVARAQNQHRVGDNDGAWTTLRPLVESGRTDAPLAIVFAEVAPHVSELDRAVTLCRRALADRAINAYEEAGCRFALARLLDRQQRSDEAFEQFRKANALTDRRFDRAAYTARLDETIADTPSADSGVADDRPVLIVGMPRSGTTLVERMLAMHPDVAAGGELNYLAQLARRLGDAPLDKLATAYLRKLDAISPTARRITDKNPTNWQHLGPISKLLPKARIIWCRRDPMAVGFSCFTQHFSGNHPWTYDLDDIACVQREHDRVMQHWRSTLSIPILELHYEDLVREPAQLGRALYAFCELTWTDDALRFHEQASPVATASYEQVRRPIYTDANEKWKRYAGWLTPLDQGRSAV